MNLNIFSQWVIKEYLLYTSLIPFLLQKIDEQLRVLFHKDHQQKTGKMRIPNYFDSRLCLDNDFGKRTSLYSG
jgi:hypothetical protein